ncbi:MAG: metal-dependent hydrolase [Anaerolineae bacterium]|nr:metal-dependent hydrolase [Anaerolineae bacterium]
MNYVQHALIGLTTAGVGFYLGAQVGPDPPGGTTMVVAAGLVVLGSVSPDIDHPQAWISRRLPHKILGKLLPPLLLVVGLAVGLSMAGGHSVESGLRRLWTEIPLVRWALAGIGFALGLMITARLVSKTVKHRGPLHSIVFSLGVTIAAVALAMWAGRDWRFWWWGACFGHGFLIHVLSDGLTRFGVPLWWPFSNKRVRLFGLPLY